MAYATKLSSRSFSTGIRLMSQMGDLGGGSGKGGGSGGSIRDSGGAFGKLEAAREGEYFYKLQKAQIKALKDQISREVEHHEQQAKHAKEVVDRHKKRIEELEKEEDVIDKNYK